MFCRHVSNVNEIVLIIRRLFEHELPSLYVIYAGWKSYASLLYKLADPTYNETNNDFGFHLFV